MAKPTGLSREGAITPSTPPLLKQPAVLVAVQARFADESVMVLNSFPLLSVVCEKLPCLSSAVGTRKKLTAPPVVVGCTSSDINQNALCCPRPGRPTGPPNVPPHCLVSEYDLATPFALLAQELEFQPECWS